MNVMDGSGLKVWNRWNSVYEIRCVKLDRRKNGKWIDNWSEQTDVSHAEYMDLSGYVHTCSEDGDDRNVSVSSLMINRVCSLEVQQRKA